MKVGVFGGTFDPPHLGHLILSELIRDDTDLQEILWVTAGEPPHKQGRQITAVEHRHRMVELAIQGNSIFKASRLDIDRPGPHYTVDTLRLIAAERPNDQLYLLIGADSLVDLPDWDRPELLNDYATILVMGRQGSQPDMNLLSDQHPQIYRQVVMANLPLIDLSANIIRRRIAASQTVKYLIPSDVEAYIRENDLYY